MSIDGNDVALTPSEGIEATQDRKESWWKRLGAGFVTGAADDDPSGVATYSQVGAKFGYALLWIMFLTIPLMIAIQMVSARIGRVTGRGLADNLSRNFPAAAVWSLVGLLVIANVINIAADIAAMGAAVQLLTGGPTLLYGVLLAVISTALQVFVPFNKYAPILKFLALSLFSYVATVFAVKVPWGEVLKSTVLPHLQWNIDYLTAIVAVLGTTISPYLFCWQAAQEVEEIRDSDEREPLKQADHQAPDALKRIAMDTSVGMTFFQPGGLLHDCDGCRCTARARQNGYPIHSRGSASAETHRQALRVSFFLSRHRQHGHACRTRARRRYSIRSGRSETRYVWTRA